MATYSSWSALNKALQKKINETMQDEVFEEVRDVYQKNIQSDIYDAYSPTQYTRRMSLLDDSNIVGEVDNGVLEVKNIANPNESIAQPQTLYNPTNETQFISWIEHGEAYNGKAKYLFKGDMSSEP